MDTLAAGGAANEATAACLLGLAAYGGMRTLSQVSKELQLPLFTPIGQVRRRVLPLGGAARPGARMRRDCSRTLPPAARGGFAACPRHSN